MATTNQMVDTTREDPLVGFHFAVEIQGAISGYFTECSGLGSENEVVEHKVVNEKGVEVVMKIPGRLKWENIVLKRGITSNMDIWTWRKKVEDGDIASARQNGSIVMYDQSAGRGCALEFRQRLAVEGNRSLPQGRWQRDWR